MLTEGFRKAQRLAYKCAVSIGKEIKEGWTEKETAKLMDTWLQDHGVRSFFHKSFAWFGDRTRFEGFTKYWHFMPSKRALQANDVIILDTAPIVENYPADIGYTLSLNDNPALEKALARLREFRVELTTLFSSEMSTSEIWAKVDRDLRASGYANCHRKYPFEVLGHQLHPMPLSRFPGLTIPFSLHTYWSILSRGVFSELLGPKHNGSKLGIWAIEPHIGGAGFGAKFEEILVVTKEGAVWLDDEVPHVIC